ncbi:MAG TPA: MFS transporter [Bryobacteraceae bacterium]|nr:MFS transporter [Bryobacteraceae bacterium]
MNDFAALLRRNRNYCFTWSGQVVSEVGDHFNNIAVFSLALANTGSGLVVAGILIARAIPAMFAGPIAGVLLDRWDRKRIMITSDLVRAVIAITFLLGIPAGRTWLLYVLSGLLMFASPFFTAGRASILPSIATQDELHTANSLTQLTQWTTVTIGSFLGGASVGSFGYKIAFLFNAASFVFSAACISRLRPAGDRSDVERGFRSERASLNEGQVVRPWHDYVEGLRYMRASPLILGIGLVAVGWATGGGAAQILFSLFGEQVFHRGPDGIGIIWGCAGIGLICGALLANAIGRWIRFETYKRVISISYVIHGLSYVLFSQAPSFAMACLFIGMSRGAVAVSSVLNTAQLLRHVSNDFRGRVFSTIETWTWSTMLISMAIAGVASDHVSPRVIGAWSGAASSCTALFWGWANWTGRLPEPALAGVAPEEVEVHGDPTI